MFASSDIISAANSIQSTSETGISTILSQTDDLNLLISVIGFVLLGGTVVLFWKSKSLLRQLSFGIAFMVIVTVLSNVLSMRYSEASETMFEEYRHAARIASGVNNMSATFFEMRIAVRGSQLGLGDSETVRFKDEFAIFTTMLQRMDNLVGSREKLDAELQLLRNQVKRYVEMYQSAVEGSVAFTDPVFISGMATLGSEISAQLNTISDRQLKIQDTIGPVIQQKFAYVQTMVLLTALFSIFAGSGFGVFIHRSSKKVLTGITGRIDEASLTVSSASRQVAQGSEVLAASSSQQAASLEEISASVEELASLSANNLNLTNYAREVSVQAHTTAEHGAEAVATMQLAIHQMAARSGEISKIIKSIDDIAFQTNILALNASVEAARAGQAGLGFSVVADEVRELAKRAAAAAKNTESLLETSATDTRNTLTAASSVSKQLTGILENVREMERAMSDISTASNQQNEGLQQIAQAISQLDSVTQNTASTSEETSAASIEMQSQAEALRRVVSDLKRLIQDANDNSKFADVRSKKNTANRSKPSKSEIQANINGAFEHAAA